MGGVFSFHFGSNQIWDLGWKAILYLNELCLGQVVVFDHIQSLEQHHGIDPLCKLSSFVSFVLPRSKEISIYLLAMILTVKQIASWSWAFEVFAPLFYWSLSAFIVVATDLGFKELIKGRFDVRPFITIHFQIDTRVGFVDWINLENCFVEQLLGSSLLIILVCHEVSFLGCLRGDLGNLSSGTLDRRVAILAFGLGFVPIWWSGAWNLLKHVIILEKILPIYEAVVVMVELHEQFYAVSSSCYQLLVIVSSPFCFYLFL